MKADDNKIKRFSTIINFRFMRASNSPDDMKIRRRGYDNELLKKINADERSNKNDAALGLLIIRATEKSPILSMNDMSVFKMKRGMQDRRNETDSDFNFSP